MATPIKQKPAPLKINVPSDDEDDPKPAPKAKAVPEQSETQESTAKVKGPDSDVKSSEPVRVSAKPAVDDMVVITVFQKISPPPVIGFWNGMHELGVSEMIPQKGYRVPRHVAAVMEDAKKAVIIS